MDINRFSCFGGKCIQCNESGFERLPIVECVQCNGTGASQRADSSDSIHHERSRSHSHSN